MEEEAARAWHFAFEATPGHAAGGGSIVSRRLMPRSEVLEFVRAQANGAPFTLEPVRPPATREAAGSARLPGG